MKPACTYTNIVEIVADTQIPVEDKGDVLVIGGSYMQKLCFMLKKANRTVKHICCSVPPQQKSLPFSQR